MKHFCFRIALLSSVEARVEGIVGGSVEVFRVNAHGSARDTHLTQVSLSEALLGP